MIYSKDIVIQPFLDWLKLMIYSQLDSDRNCYFDGHPVTIFLSLITFTAIPILFPYLSRFNINTILILFIHKRHLYTFSVLLILIYFYDNLYKSGYESDGIPSYFLPILLTYLFHYSPIIFSVIPILIHTHP